MEGGWAVVLIYDYLKGSDFADVELVGPGEASGSYKEFEVKDKAFTTVRFR